MNRNAEVELPVRPVMEERPRRVYSSAAPRPMPSGIAPRQNRRAIRRRRSTFTIVLALFGVGAAIVLYVSNIIAVNHLAREVNTLQQQHDSLLHANRILSAQIDRQSALDRIGAIAVDRLGLQYATETPAGLEVDEDRIRSIQEP